MKVLIMNSELWVVLTYFACNEKSVHTLIQVQDTLLTMHIPTKL